MYISVGTPFNHCIVGTPSKHCIVGTPFNHCICFIIRRTWDLLKGRTYITCFFQQSVLGANKGRESNRLNVPKLKSFTKIRNYHRNRRARHRTSIIVSRTSCKACRDAGGRGAYALFCICLLYTSPSPRDLSTSRMPSSA